VLVLSPGTAGYEVYASRGADSVLSNASLANDALITKMRALEQRSQSAERDLAQTRQAVESARAAQAAGPRPPAMGTVVSGGAPAAMWDAVKEGSAFLTRHPEARQAIIDRSSAKLNFRWGALFKELNLNPPQI